MYRGFFELQAEQQTANKPSNLTVTREWVANRSKQVVLVGKVVGVELGNWLGRLVGWLRWVHSWLGNWSAAV